jgi:hypothetical protein
MAVLMPKKLQDFLDKLSGPRKNRFLEQDGSVRPVDKTKPFDFGHRGYAGSAVHVSLSV